MEKTQFDLGMATMNRIMGDHGQLAYEGVKMLDPDIAELVVSFGFGELYAGDTLSDRDRVLITLTSLITQGAYDQLALHVHTAVNIGLTKAELLQVMRQCIGYVGFPKVLASLQVLNKTFEEVSKS